MFSHFYEFIWTVLLRILNNKTGILLELLLLLFIPQLSIYGLLYIQYIRVNISFLVVLIGFCDLVKSMHGLLVYEPLFWRNCWVANLQLQRIHFWVYSYFSSYLTSLDYWDVNFNWDWNYYVKNLLIWIAYLRFG